MGLKYKKSDKILELFYEFPTKRFTVREIAKLTRLPKSTAHKYLQDLKKVGIITKENRAAKTKLFEIKKISYFIEKIIKSGLIDFLEEKLTPSCIILFGSFRKGESEHESDIDLFIETTKTQKLNLEKFEKKLGHRIQLFQEANIKKLPIHLFNNVVNGIKLQGYFKIK